MHKPNPTKQLSAINTIRLGVWDILTEKSTALAIDPIARLYGFQKSIPQIQQFCQDIYALGPTLLIAFYACQLFHGIEPIILLHFSSRLLDVMEDGLRTGNLEAWAVGRAVVARLFWVLLASVAEWGVDCPRPRVKTRILLHFEERILLDKLKIDAATAGERSKTEALARDAWECFWYMTHYSTSVASALSQLWFISQAFQSGLGGKYFAIMCIAEPCTSIIMGSSLWDQAHVVHSTNEAFLRMRSLNDMSDEKFRKEVISGNLFGYISREYRKAREALGDTVVEDAYRLFSTKGGLAGTLVEHIAGDMPMLYYAAVALFRPSTFSIGSAAALEQSSTLLKQTVYGIVAQTSGLREKWALVMQIYALSNVKNKITDGDRAYPTPESSFTGMELELRNVSFSYPGTKSDVNALNNVSFSIPAGSLVVVVGANGSGKSTLVNLLTRMYDTSSGNILVDGHDIRSYRITDLRKATALLTQDHELYPLTLRENIGLGCPAEVDNEEMVMQAARDGGAHEMIQKFVHKYETVLTPPRTLFAAGDVIDGPLVEELERIEKRAEVSGGEKQRLVAARTFMRFNTGEIKLVAVDEPSSALDPHGEWELFQNIREHRTGKTMIFVTHRFGHLTRHADMIICMKDSELNEIGTHDELMESGGEYAKLYNVQAEAFVQI